MKKMHAFLLFLLYFTVPGNAQYKYDNTAFHTVYLEDLPKALKNSPHRLLLDVRSPGEYNDTSMYDNLNIGRLKGSKNITIREIDKRLSEIREYKNQPIFLYCSHSQRSRRVGKLLADSGFTNVTNVNGGMTAFHLIKDHAHKLNTLFEKNTSFDLVSPESAYQLIKSDQGLTILDVRPDSAYMGTAHQEKLNAFGKIVGSKHIPLDQLKSSMESIPKDKPVLLIDSYGDESILAAALLHDRGFNTIKVLFNGLDEWVSSDFFKGKDKTWDQSNRYGFISSAEFDHRMNRSPSPLILDVRTSDAFKNQDTVMSFHNKGHIQHAINIPADQLSSRMNEIESAKNKEIIVYAFSNSPEAFAAAKLLTDHGFTTVKVLTGGLWDLRWKAANLKGLSHIMKWIVDVPAENL